MPPVKIKKTDVGYVVYQKIKREWVPLNAFRTIEDANEHASFVKKMFRSMKRKKPKKFPVRRR